MRRFAMALVLAGASIALMMVAPASAGAAAYDGTDPAATGCSSTAVTIYSKMVGSYAYVELRYSRGCRTTWARLFGGYQGEPGNCAASYTIIHRDSDGLEYRRTWTSSDNGSIYTRQVNDANVTSYAFASVDYCWAGPFNVRTPSY